MTRRKRIAEPVGTDQRSPLSDKARGSGRPFSPETAWAVLFMASGADPAWLGANVGRSLRRRLKRQSGSSLLEQLPRLSRRGSVRYFLGSVAAQAEIREHPAFVASGVSGADHYGANVIAPGVLEGYLPANEIERLAHLFALREVEELRANLILRAPAIWPFVSEGVAPRAVVAVDLLESASQRTKDAGRDLLRAGT